MMERVLASKHPAANAIDEPIRRRVAMLNVDEREEIRSKLTAIERRASMTKSVRR